MHTIPAESTNLIFMAIDLEKITKAYKERTAVLESAQILVGSIEHDAGHLQQALINIQEGLQSRTMTEDRALELIQNIGNRLDTHSNDLLEATGNKA